MSVTYYGSASNPADNASALDTASPLVIIPPASMVAKDLVFVITGEYDGGALTHSVLQAGGQTWNSLTQHTDGTVGAFRGFWCQFNGTWSASPSFATTDNADFSDFSAVMLVFRPSASSATWAVDVAESAATYTAPSAPNDVTITGQTALAISGVHLAFWMSGVTNITYALQTAGWTVPAAQYRNTANSQLTLALAYKIFTAAGASGSVTNRQSTPEPGWKSIITFKETLPATARFPSFLYG